MTTQNKHEIRVAILDLYNGIANQGMAGFFEILNRYSINKNLNISYKVFDVRRSNEVPGTEFDIYLSSGGPGSPIDSQDTEWENNYFDLIDALQEHNNSNQGPKKHVLFVCHSFQLMCRRMGLGNVCLRFTPSYGVVPVHFTAIGSADPAFKGLKDPFYALDSRSWQVINPNGERFSASGAVILAMEHDQPYTNPPKAMMAIRFNEYFLGTQFHPEADPAIMKTHLLTAEKKTQMISEQDEQQYEEMLRRIEDPEMLALTQNTIIPNFLDQAIAGLGLE